MNAGSVATASEQSRLAIEEDPGHRGIVERSCQVLRYSSQRGRHCGDGGLDVRPLQIWGRGDLASSGGRRGWDGE